MKVLVDVEYGKDLIDVTYVEELALFAMGQLDLSDSTEVSIVFIDNDHMADYNFSYRGIEGPTDVLSFECDNLVDDFPAFDPSEASNSNEVYSLGDIAIAPDICLKQAGEFGNTFTEELSLLLIHGILHLCGYDHIDDDDAQKMETMQTELLNLWGRTSNE